MKVAEVLEKATKIREAKRDEGLVNRAVHFMKAAEKAAEIAEFIERGSTSFPGADGEAGDPIPGNENVGEQIIDPRTPTVRRDGDNILVTLVYDFQFITLLIRTRP